MRDHGRTAVRQLLEDLCPLGMDGLAQSAQAGEHLVGAEIQEPRRTPVHLSALGKYQRGATAPADTRFGKAPALRDRYVTPRNEDIVEKLQAFAKARGHSMLEIAFSWLAARPQVSSVIAGATRVEQVEQNVKAIAWQLSADDLAEIDGITRG